MPAQALAAVATLLAFAPHGNRIEFLADHGAAEIVWLTPSTFHFRRTLNGLLPPQQPREEEREPTELHIDNTPSAVLVRSKYIEAAIQKRGLLVTVRRTSNSRPLMVDLSEPQPEGAGFAWDRQAQPGAQFYGLGPAGGPAFALQGRVRTPDAFLLATTGFAEEHPGGGSFLFDFTVPGRYHITAPRIDYFFYYGPAPKEIFEERKPAGQQPWRVSEPSFGSWTTLRDSVLAMVHGALSGMLQPTFDLAPWANAPPGLFERARQVASLVPLVNPGKVELSSFRRQLDSFFAAYEPELTDRGHPTWHPLPLEFPDDPECALHADEFMLGDEMLIAPIFDATGKRTVYLPQGTWTNWETNQTLPGRRTITVNTPSLPVFARAGTIIPLDSRAGITLHYFPKLAAEFFLLERDLDEYSQVHAAPAADEMRLEIESKKARDYQWVVHHVERPLEVGFADLKYPSVTSPARMSDRTWSYDAARKNLQIRVKVKAGEDCIINLTW